MLNFFSGKEKEKSILVTKQKFHELERYLAQQYDQHC